MSCEKCNLVDKISIIVPVYNVSPYLEQCLDSLIEQTYQNIEIICVNDGSTDDSFSILKKYEKKSNLIRVISQRNQGLSGARNTGISFATGKYMMFVDSDDWVDKRICEELLEEAVSHNADCVMCSYCKAYGSRVIENHIFKDHIVWNETETKERFYRRLFGPIGEETARPYDVDIIVSACMQLFRTEVCEGIEFIDTKKVGTEDCLYQIMVYKNCKRFVYIDKPYYYYRKTNEASLTTKYNPFLFERWQNMYDIMEEMIVQDNSKPVYKEALNNRIVFALIGLGLNEVTANVSLFSKSKRLQYIISGSRYQNAFANLSVRHMSFPWKFFFLMLKHNTTIPVVIMLEIIQKIRGR